MSFRSAGLLCLTLAAAPVAAQAPGRDYVVLVASEAVDRITRVRFGPGAGPSLIKVEDSTTIGVTPQEPDGPHGLAVSPDGRHYYVTTAHGVPFGYVWSWTRARTRLWAGSSLGTFPRPRS